MWACDRRFDWQIRDKVKVQHSKSRRYAPEVFSRGFAARVFGLRPKTSRPAADEAPRRTREKTSGTQGIHFPDSGLYLLNGFDFILIYFEWRDTENQQ